MLQRLFLLLRYCIILALVEQSDSHIDKLKLNEKELYPICRLRKFDTNFLLLLITRPIEDIQSIFLRDGI